MREIVFDTETTGRDPDAGDRIVEIGCVELYNLSPTGRTLHFYMNPQCEVVEEVVRVHGLTGAFLRDKPLFADIAEKILEFFEDSPLIAHNSEFDRRFLYAELARAGKAQPGMERFIDTLQIARRRFPGASCSLDALAKRFQLDRYGFDLAARKGPGGHGALVDAKILAEVYLQLKGGREQKLMFESEAQNLTLADNVQRVIFTPRSPRPAPLPARLTPEEEEAHKAFVADLGAAALWRKYA
ncbi:MAG TPA: DNA polymerase III subunit epsilon [Caulobacterales bacterium]|nr:DNA polymerase III subunit epsilon [Caulobacterales bacterium]